MKRIATAFASALLIAAAPATSPKLQCDALVQALLPQVEKALSADGKFSPMGATMDAAGKVALVPTLAGAAPQKSSARVQAIHGQLRGGARKGAFRATALAFDGQIAMAGTSKMSDAVAIELDHRDDYSVVLFYPYTITGGKVTFGPPQSNPGGDTIFR